MMLTTFALACKPHWWPLQSLLKQAAAHAIHQCNQDCNMSVHACAEETMLAAFQS